MQELASSKDRTEGSQEQSYVHQFHLRSSANTEISSFDEEASIRSGYLTIFFCLVICAHRYRIIQVFAFVSLTWRNPRVIGKPFCASVLFGRDNKFVTFEYVLNNCQFPIMWILDIDRID